MAYLNNEDPEELHDALSKALDVLHMLEGATGEKANRGALAREVRDLLLDMYGKIRNLTGQCHAIDAMGEMALRREGRGSA